MKKFLLALLALSTFGSATAGNQGLDWLQTASGGFVAMPPVSVTDGVVGRTSWSPDGAYLFVAERPNVLTQEQALMTGADYAQGMLHLLVWDKEFQRVRVMWTTEDPSQKIESIDWVHGTSTAYITFKWTVQDSPNGVTHPVYGVVWLDANSGRYLWVAGMEHLVSRPLFYPSPTRASVAAVFSDKPTDERSTLSNWFTSRTGNSGDDNTIAVVIQGELNELTRLTKDYIDVDQHRAKGNNYWTLDGNGSVKNSIKLDHTLELPLIWNRDGSAWFLQQMDQAAGKQGLFRLTSQGSLEKTDEVEFISTSRTPSLGVESKGGTTELGKSKASFTSLWLKSLEPSDHSEFILTPNGDWPELSPTEGAVFYIDGGVAKVRSLIALSKGQMKQLQTAEKECVSAVNLQSVLGEASFQLKLSIVGSGGAPPPQP